MSVDPILFALKTPGHILFPGNRVFVEDVVRAGGRVVRRSTGHLVFYRPDGRRFLAADPAGNPLHECEWTVDAQGRISMSRARIKLDWGAWVGIVAGGLVNETTLNLASRPGWRRLTPDDLRMMAAQALGVSLDEVRWFYRDDDLLINQTGQATIRHRKDALYRLEDGDFGRAQFMSCMGAMHWHEIDFLPVVELFKSLLPGTGSATFELIRGLYDDQNESRKSPVPLRYRGIPAYPSEAAFRLFGSFYTPQAPPAVDPLAVFLDPARAHQVLWHPAPSPPLRYFDAAQGACLTCKGDVLQKVTLADDAAGLPFVHPRGRKFVNCDRTASIVSGSVVVTDRHHATILPVPVPDQCQEPFSEAAAVSPVDWRALFKHGIPPIPSQEAFGAVLLYPANEDEIGETAAQPFVADYIQDLAEQDSGLGRVLAGADRVLIENGDAVIVTCIAFDRPREYTVRVRVPAHAQRQAQQLWTACAELQRWDWLTNIRFLPIKGLLPEQESVRPYDLLYYWAPYGMGEDPEFLATLAAQIGSALGLGGHAFVVGSAGLEAFLMSSGFSLLWKEPVDQLPTFRMHRNILPKSRLKAGLTLYYIKKTSVIS